MKCNSPIAVDLDGTFIRSDLLYELIWQLLRHKPWMIFAVFLWLLQGRLVLKNKLALVAGRWLDINSLPYNEDLRDFLTAKKEQGAEIVLISASNNRLVSKIAHKFNNIFSNSAGSDSKINLKSIAKAEFLKNLYPKGFIYAGNSNADIDVWNAADGAIIVNAPKNMADKISSPVIRFFGQKNSTLAALIKSLRLHHLVKNILVFIPLALTPANAELALWVQTFAGFVLFSMMGSGTYMLNDLFDLENDRLHATKKYRPIAYGSLHLPVAIVSAKLLILLSLVGAYFLSADFLKILIFYMVLTLTYSYKLKKVAPLDVMVLGILYTTRIVGGIFLADTIISPWLLVFSLCFFTSLSLVKRVAEIIKQKERGKGSLGGRGYTVADRKYLESMGIAVSVASAIIFVIYLVDGPLKERNFGNPELFWGIFCVLFYWLMRLWLLATRGEILEDPVTFALKDKTSILLALLCFALIFLAV